MAKKAVRDPSAPKRNTSAYLLYQNAMREQFRALNPGMTFGQLAKYTSAMYAEMPAGEKEAWQNRAESDKARYLHELAMYRPPPGFDSKGDAINQEEPLSKHSAAAAAAASVPRNHKADDPNKPKRNMSAYLLYQNAMRDTFKRDNPGMTFGQLAKLTSQMYKNLIPREKAQWEARAAQDKARYESQLHSYIPPPGHDAKGKAIMPGKQIRKKRSKASAKDPNAPKRASGAYVFFTQEMRPQINSEQPGIKFVDMGRILGERWRELDADSKKRYEEMAAEDKLRWQKEVEVYQANGGGVKAPQPQQQEYHQPEPPVSRYEPPAAHHQQYQQEEEQDPQQHYQALQYEQQHAAYYLQQQQYEQQHAAYYQQQQQLQQQQQQYDPSHIQMTHRQYADANQQQQYDPNQAYYDQQQYN